MNQIHGLVKTMPVPRMNGYIIFIIIHCFFSTGEKDAQFSLLDSITNMKGIAEGNSVFANEIFSTISLPFYNIN